MSDRNWSFGMGFVIEDGMKKGSLFLKPFESYNPATRLELVKILGISYFSSLSMEAEIQQLREIFLANHS